MPQRLESNRPAGVWLLACLPLIPLALVFWAYQLPANSTQAVMALAGAWEGHVAGPAFEGLTDQSPSWLKVHLPGGLASQGLRAERVWLRRTFDAPPELPGHDGVLIIGSLRGSTMRLYFNGVAIGLRGEPSTGFMGAEAGAESYFVPAAIIRPTGNTLTFDVVSLGPGRDGLTDPRMLLGRYDVLGPWGFTEHQVRSLLELGALLLIAFLSVLLGSLWVLQGSKADRDLYRSTLVLLFAASAYLMGKTGLLVSSFVNGRHQLLVVLLSVHLLGLGMGEFLEAYFLQRATWFRQLNRVVSLGALGISVVGSVLTRTWPVYQLFIDWLFVLVIYGIVLGVRDLVKGLTPFGPLVAMGTIIVALSGVSDLLGDLDLVYAPRLFTFAIANLAALSAAVVIAEFLQIARENTRLSVSLKLRAEELSEALVKAEEGSRTKSEFLANTSHELRTPLNAIINIPQGLLEQFEELRHARCPSCAALFQLEAGEAMPAACPSCGKPGLTEESKLSMGLGPEETARLLKSIVRSGNHLLSVVNDILDFSKLEAGRVVLYPEPVSCGALLEDLRSVMEPVASQAGVKLVTEAPEREAALTLEVDRVKVGQVLINLVGNAIKFSDGKGTVTLMASLTGQTLALKVHDQGIGIAPQHLAMIFEGFRQVEGSSTRRFGGSGLGLAISKRLVEMHGGALKVESTLGEGSTFIVELPLAPVVKPEEPAPSDAQVVVIVDDESSAVDSTTVALKPLGCRVLAVRDPRQALELLKEQRPALLVLDVMMPRISGLELLKALRADPALAGLPVLVSSAYPDNRPAALALGASFIAKPWAPGELLRTVSALLSGASSEERSRS